ncbi:MULTISPECIES: hypothetical protein [Streptomyces]|jgi:hypothetical protein|uniref:hypothetical protein n=1 Tax=Streptomyces TaxID=1883 RepID=UPI001BFEFA68|nr:MULTISPECIES: hypothetical protein [unclassified Streptomyces]WNZ09946.1 hypothetical protein P8T65_21675 [Streptomyces sp. 11x1]
MTYTVTADVRTTIEAGTSAEEELDLVIGELEQDIPQRTKAAASTCVRWYCL